MAYSAATGAQLWVQRYNDPGNGMDWTRAVAVGRHGTKAYVYVTGESWSGQATGVDYLTSAYRG